MPSIKNPAFPPGSLVLVSGANGFIGTHIVNLFIKEGYKVRGTVRDIQKNAWLKDLFAHDVFELYALPDLTRAAAWQHALEGVSAVVHAAGDTSFGPDAEAIIPLEVNAVKAAVEAATASSSVKRFVLTSSSIAAAFPQQDVDYKVATWDFNEAAIELAWKTSEDPAQGVNVYAAAKASAEKAMWDVAKTEGSVVFNSVLPDSTFGAPLHAGQGMTSSPGACLASFHGMQEVMNMVATLVKPQYMISALDAARLYVIAALHPDVKDERLFGCAEPYNYNRLLAFYRRRFPDKHFVEDFSGLGMDRGVIEGRERAAQLLRETFGNPNGFETFEEAIEDVVKDWS